MNSNDLKRLREMNAADGGDYTGEFLVEAQGVLTRLKHDLLSARTTDEDRFYAMRVLRVVNGVSHLHPDGEITTREWCLDFVNDFCDDAKIATLKDKDAKVIASTPSWEAGVTNDFTRYDIWTGEAHNEQYLAKLALQWRRKAT